MLTAEKTHLLLTRDSGRSAAPAHHDVALAAAVLADLRQAGVVTVEDAPVKDARLWVVAGGTTDHPVLDALLPAVEGLSGRQVATLVAKGRPKARGPIVAHLVETGELTEHKAFLATHQEPASPAAREGLVARLTAVVLDEQEPTDEDVLLLGVLQHLNLARLMLPGTHERFDRREGARRIESLTRHDLLVQAVRRAVAGPSGAAAAAAAGAPPAA